MKSISVITACLNEEDNIETVYERVRAEFSKLNRYCYEHIFIDNASTDQTVTILKRLAAVDPNVKIIVNARNFGQIRSPFHALTQAKGDAVIGIVADLQDPPELIPALLDAWEEGYASVLCIKRSSAENPVVYNVRKLYYRTLNKISEIETFENFTGFGLFDRRVVDYVISCAGPKPYFRGLVAEIGLPHKKIYYDQPKRERGKTKNNIFTLYDFAMVGITNHSKLPLRLAVFTGFAGAVLSLAISFSYLIYKILFWNSFSLGLAPLIIGLFFIASLQLVFMGILGEYIGDIHTQLQRRPYAVEKERVNFDFPPAPPRVNRDSPGA